MPVYSEEDAQILTRLGLTTRQAIVYLTLAKLGKAKISTISSTSKIDRGNTYRVMTRLQELNLVEKVIAYPSVFEALPVPEGIAMLLERKEKEQAAFKVKVKKVIERHKQSSEVDPIQDDCQFALIPGGKLTYRKVTEMWDSNKRTHKIIIYWKDFKHRTNQFITIWRKLLKKGIKFQAIIFFQGKEKLPKEIEDLRKQYSRFQIRSTSRPPKSTISIIDGEKAFISLAPSLFPSNSPSLWINNPILVEIIQEYFENIWLDSKELI
jgi:sugar-specific transcriptional regulator TrmB